MCSKHYLASSRIVLPENVRPAAIVIAGGKIIDILNVSEISPDLPGTDCGDHVIMPGLIDAHVHINDPGSDWEGFQTATQAAAAGGVTTILDMPLNCIPVTTSVEALKLKLAAAEGKLSVNCGFYGGFIPGNEKEIPGLIDAGVFGVKAFLCRSGLDEFPNVSFQEIESILPSLAEASVPLLVHAELESAAHIDSKKLVSYPENYQAYLQSRPAAWENAAVARLIDLSEKFDARIHIVHLSSSEALTIIREAKERGMKISAETCPHYLYFAAEEIADANTLFKCAPPIRSRRNQEALWEGVRAGLIDTIGSDHSPCPPEMRGLQTGNFAKAWGGIASLQFILPAFWTAAKAKSISLSKLAELTSAVPARILGLEKKGAIEIGKDADFVIWEPDSVFVVEPAMIKHRHKDTPYCGEMLKGVVKQTYLGGEQIFADEKSEQNKFGKPLFRC